MSICLCISSTLFDFQWIVVAPFVSELYPTTIKSDGSGVIIERVILACDYQYPQVPVSKVDTRTFCYLYLTQNVIDNLSQTLSHFRNNLR